MGWRWTLSSPNHPTRKAPHAAAPRRDGKADFREVPRREGKADFGAAPGVRKDNGPARGFVRRDFR